MVPGDGETKKKVPFPLGVRGRVKTPMMTMTHEFHVTRHATQETMNGSRETNNNHDGTGKEMAHG